MDKRRWIVALLLTVVVMAGIVGVGLAANAKFEADLSGDHEVPIVLTTAEGEATFKLSKDGKSLNYKLQVHDIQNVTMSHIHLAPTGVNGPVVAWLYPAQPPAQLIPGESNGVIAKGTLTKANLVGPMAGKEIADLVAAIQAGNAYVNVHTSAHPAGEMRGQVHGPDDEGHDD